MFYHWHSTLVDRLCTIIPLGKVVGRAIEMLLILIAFSDRRHVLGCPDHEFPHVCLLAAHGSLPWGGIRWKR